MKELLKGIASFDHILTEEDVLRYNGATPVPEPVASAPSESAPEPEPEPLADQPPPSDEALSDADLAAKLETENTKAALIAMAETAGLDQSGNKAELSARLVSHYRSQK